MGRSYSQVYVHLVWGTWCRRPQITPEVQKRLYAAVLSICADLRCHVHALGGVEDHVHLLVELPTALSVAGLAKRLKGSTSHLLHHQHRYPLRWQVGYGAFSVSRRHLPAVSAYVRDQPRRHQTGRLNLALERTEPAPQSAQPTSRVR